MSTYLKIASRYTHTCTCIVCIVV